MLTAASWSRPSQTRVPVRTDDITVTAVRGDETKEVSLTVTQRADGATDLSAAGTANCYVANTKRFVQDPR